MSRIESARGSESISAAEGLECDEVVVGDREAGRFKRARGAPRARPEKRATGFDYQLAHARLHGKSRRFAALKTKSEIRPMTPITMMPKMI